jgi:hypothetical protein
MKPHLFRSAGRSLPFFVRHLIFKKSGLSLLVLLHFRVFNCVFQNTFVSAATSFSLENVRHHRQRLPADLPSIMQYLQVQHSLGNRNSRFTICGIATPLSSTGSTSDSFEWRLNMHEVPLQQLAIPPDANFSVNGRQERVVGDLGYSFLSLDLGKDQRSPTFEASYAFLIVDWNSSTLGGVVVKSGEVAYIDEHSFIIVESSLHVSGPLSEELLTADLPPPNLQFQINLVIDINRALVQQIGGGSLCHTIAYLNSLLTAVNMILEHEVKARLNVQAISQTSLYDNNNDDLDRSLDSSGILLSSQKHVEAKRIDMSYVFLGTGSSKFDLASNSASMLQTNFSTVCSSQRGLGMIIDWTGNAVSWGEGWFKDLNQLLSLVG